MIVKFEYSISVFFHILQLWENIKVQLSELTNVSILLGLPQVVKFHKMFRCIQAFSFTCIDPFGLLVEFCL